ncbi:MAG: putative integral rane protein, partial [Chloroflexota bacterium]|nr:putative integral rane protein [Chloroflexota bacterium]
IERRLVLPGAVVQGITGVALILILGADLTSPTYRWLVGGIILYLIAISFAAFVQARNAEKLVHLTAGGPPPGPPPAGAPAGPPPEVAATIQALQRGGMILTVLIVLIVILMVTKPGF